MKEKGKYRLLKLFSIYIVAVLVGLIFALLFDGLKLYSIVFYIIVIFGLYLYAKKEKPMWEPWVGKVYREGWIRAGISTLFILVCIILVITLKTAVWMEGIYEEFKFDIFAFIGTCCLAPITEEIIFRGIVLDILREKHSNAFAIIFSAVIFYIVHGKFMNIGTLFLGLFAGWTVIKAKSVIPGVMIHFIWNVVIYFSPVIASYLANSNFVHRF